MARAASVLLGNGSKLYYRGVDGSGVGTGSYTVIPSLKNIALPEREREEVNTTDLDSVDNSKEYSLGDVEPGESSCDVHFNPANATHQALDAASLTDNVYQWKAELVSGYYTTWYGRIKNFLGGATLERNTPVEGPLVIRNTSIRTAFTL